MSGDYSQLQVIEAAPNARSGPEGAENVFKKLRGASILRIGSAPFNRDFRIEGGGLIIDYQHAELGACRVVFAFNENGLWVEYDGPLQKI